MRLALSQRVAVELARHDRVELDCSSSKRHCWSNVTQCNCLFTLEFCWKFGVNKCALFTNLESKFPHPSTDQISPNSFTIVQIAEIHSHGNYRARRWLESLSEVAISHPLEMGNDNKTGVKDLL